MMMGRCFSVKSCLKRQSCAVSESKKTRSVCVNILAPADMARHDARTGRRIQNNILVISYETFRLYSTILCKRPVGLVICDEVRAHRTLSLWSELFHAWVESACF